MVYIQSDSERRLPHNFDAACAMYGAKESVQDIRLTSFEEVGSGKFDLLINKNLFVGSVDFMTEVFRRSGKTVPAMSNPFQDFLKTTTSAARDKIENGERWFIKPVESKLFTGMVFDPSTLPQLKQLGDNVEVLLAKPFDTKIAVEIRCYVHLNKILDARCYSGDFRISPDWKWAEFTVQSLHNAPVAFTMDIAVLESGNNVVVEFNDMWAIGNYGLDNIEYYNLLRARYLEIMSP